MATPGFTSMSKLQRSSDCYVSPSLLASPVLISAALRVADSLVLPLNTTQYAIELQYYLEK